MKFTDCHTHITPADVAGKIRENFVSMIPYLDTLRKFSESPSELINYLDSCEIEAIGIMNYPSPETHGIGMEAIDSTLRYCSEFRDRLYPFGSVHPVLMSADEVLRSLETQYEKGIAGIKLHPVHQYFRPCDYREDERNMKSLEVVYEFASDHNLSVLIHTGTSMLLNARNRFGNPLFIEDVAIDFPRLNIILAHGGRPFWMREAFFILRRFRNVWLDISGIPPQKLLSEYFPRFDLISERCLYGSDFPSPGVKGIRENLEIFLGLPLNKKVKEIICYKNFKKLYRA